MRLNSSSISSFSFSRAPSTVLLSITHLVMSSGHATSVVALGTVVESSAKITKMLSHFRLNMFYLETLETLETLDSILSLVSSSLALTIIIIHVNTLYNRFLLLNGV